MQQWNGVGALWHRILVSRKGSSPLAAPVYRSLTQLDRVPVFETGSRGFESCRAGQYSCKKKAHAT